MTLKGLASIYYPVADWPRAKRFYGEALGLALTACDDQAGWAAFSIGPSAPPLFLCKKPEAAGANGGPVVGFLVADADAVMQRIVDAGGSIDGNVQEGPTVKIFTVRDPDGNTLELSEPKSSHKLD